MNSFKIVSFYTKGTGYKDYALKLAARLQFFGLDWQMEATESLGSWQANTYHKAEFLRKALDRYPDQNVVWLDVDTVLHKYPELFETIDADLAVHYIDWQKYGRSNYLELNTSVIFIRNNNKMRSIIDEWIEENRQMIDTGIWEQKNLQKILENRKDEIRIFNLPAKYCKIFDLMSQIKNPIIELMQASRRLKAEINKWL